MNESEKSFIKLAGSINSNCSKERAQLLLEFITQDRIKEGLLVCPASSSKSYHHCFEGGLLHHINQMIKIALCMRECGQPIMDRITTENLVTVIILHDLHKICDPYGKSYYITNLLKSGKVSELKPFKVADNFNDLTTTMSKYGDAILDYFIEHSDIRPSGHLSLLTLINFGIKLYNDLSTDEKHAIIYHGGTYEVSKFELRGKESMLQLILHSVDMLSSRFHEDEW